MSTKASVGGPRLAPLPWSDVDLNLPEVVELKGEDGERQWKLANLLTEAERNAWAPTAPGRLDEARW